MMREWIRLVESQRTLYHGTLKQFVPDILEIGLLPSLGEFTRQAYAEYEEAGIELPELVFAADKEGIRACVSAILGAMEQEGIPDTVENFYQHAAIVVIRSDVHSFSQRVDGDDYFDEDRYQTVEPGDYYSEYRVTPDYAITGEKLRQFLRRYGEIFDRRPSYDDRMARAELTRIGVKLNPKNKDKIVARIRALNNRQLRHLMHKVRMHDLLREV